MSDLVVLGAGPAGYVAALRAAQLDRDVVVVDDRERPGGVCLNWGCIPTKTLLHLARRYRFLGNASRYGFDVEVNGLEWEKMIRHSRRVVKKLSKGIEGLFRRNGIELVQAEGKIVAPGEVETRDGDLYEADQVLLATGARPGSFPGIVPNGDRIMTSKEALSLRHQPESLVVLGGGAVGLEFAYMFDSFGTDVTVLELTDQLLPGVDPDVASELEESLSDAGISVETNTAVESVSQPGKEVVAQTESGDEFRGDAALLALGFQPPESLPVADKLNLRTTGDGWVDVNDSQRTSLPGVYAAGDVTGAPFLAHVASTEGVKAVEAGAGLEPEPLDYNQVPAAVFCQPQVATLGLTEPEAREQYEQVRVGKFPFQALGRALAEDATEGFVKLVFAGEFKQLVGAHLVGESASELLPELTLGTRLEVTPEEISGTVHVHPTRSEAVHEAALAAVGDPLHL